MSLSIDGVWKVGVWSQTVWADGVWREGPPASQALPDSPLYFELVTPASVPGLPPAGVGGPRDPKVDNDFQALARMMNAQSYIDDLEQWIDTELGANEEYIDVFEAEGLEIDAALKGGGEQWLRRR